MLLQEHLPRSVGVDRREQKSSRGIVIVHHDRVAHNHGIGFLDVVRDQAGRRVVHQEEIHLNRSMVITKWRYRHSKNKVKT